MSRQTFAPPQPTELALENEFILYGFRPPDSHYQAGQTIDVALWLAKQASATTNHPYALSLKLWDDQGQLAVQTEPDEWPAGSLFFSPAWPAEQIIRHPMRLYLPADIPPRQYWLNAILYDSQTGQPLRVVETNETVILLGGVTITE